MANDNKSLTNPQFISSRITPGADHLEGNGQSTEAITVDINPEA